MDNNVRKGARSKKEIPNETLELLNTGKIETANLVEWLAVDQEMLFKNLMGQYKRLHYLAPVLYKISALKKQTVNTVNEIIGTTLCELITQNGDTGFLNEISNHSSDVVRCWAAYIIGKNPDLPFEEKIKRIKSFAADNHFGVREISWLSVRHEISKDPEKSIKLLSSWTSDKDANIRRFACESTRPRGVWCEHIDVLKQNPELGLSILEPLKSDKIRYVQDSVGNWLNDASKTRPDFVKQLCHCWNKENPNKETQYIIKKALRTVEK